MHEIHANRCSDRHMLLSFHCERLEAGPSSRYPVSGLRPERPLYQVLFTASLPDSTSRGHSHTIHFCRGWPCEVSRLLGRHREREAASPIDARRYSRRAQIRAATIPTIIITGCSWRPNLLGASSTRPQTSERLRWRSARNDFALGWYHRRSAIGVSTPGSDFR
jgi:hypothetical protein